MFGRIARAAAEATGTWQAFAAACALVLAWLAGGFFVGFDSELYQLLINTTTTIVTFLMVFLLQYSQDVDTKAINTKLDALIAGCDRASNRLIDLEHQPREAVDEEKRRIVEGGPP